MSVLEKRYRHLVNQAGETNARLARIERLLLQVLRADSKTENAIMALRVTDQKMINEIHRNTDVVAAARTALVNFGAVNSDLTQKLADVIANSEAKDDPEVQTALAELKKNNDDLAAATPVVAQAIGNTDPNAPPPVVNQ